MNEVTKVEIRKKLGNISQLREVLLGDKIDEYDRKLEQYKLRLDNIELSIQQSQTAIDKSIAQLESKMLQRMEEMAKILVNRTKYYSLETKEHHDKLQQQLNDVANYSHENIDELQKSFNTNINSLKIEMTQSKLDLSQDLSAFKQQLLSKFEADFSQLAENKISRPDLAEVLFELCLKLKETEISSSLTKEAEVEILAGNSDQSLSIPKG